MCIEYDTSYAKHCKEPIAEEVRKKDEANFCDYFKRRRARTCRKTRRNSRVRNRRSTICSKNNRAGGKFRIRRYINYVQGIRKLQGGIVARPRKRVSYKHKDF